MVARTREELEKIWLNVDQVKKVSDRVVGIGPFGLGIDGIISALNASGIGSVAGIALNEVYTWGAGLWLLHQAVQARASGGTMGRMFGYILIDSLVSGVPILGGFVDLFFQGHLYAAKALQKDIETTHFISGKARDAHDGGDMDRHRAAARADGKRRLVFLHD